MTFDLRIANGLLHDGTGAEPRPCDVLIRGDRVADLVPRGAGADARQVLDAGGGIVCPGFIDVHSHSDAYLLLAPGAPSKLLQGITTEVVGNCGASAAPRLGEYRMPSDWDAFDYGPGWQTFGEYRDRLAQARPAVNVMALVGHRALRCAVIGYAHRAATAAEVQRMAELLERCLAEGARGFSTGLIYAPAMAAGPDEILALARVAAARDGIYTTHMRSESGALIEAIDEAIDVARQTGVRLEISHLKTGNPAAWPKLDAALERIRAARAAGIAVAADRYPYTAGATDLDILLPDWAHEGGREAALARLADADARARIADAIRAARGERLDGVTIGSTVHPDLFPFRGLTAADAAARLGLAPIDAVLRILEIDRLQTGAFFFGMCEANLRRILAEPWVMIGSDASLRTFADGPLGADYPHPRAFGTFPRVLRMALDGETVPVAEAIRKMTRLPADHFGLAQRGRVAAGCFADLAVFDPDRVRDNATYGNPRQAPDGIVHVIVNGRVAVQQGRLTGTRHGCLL